MWLLTGCSSCQTWGLDDDDDSLNLLSSTVWGWQVRNQELICCLPVSLLPRLHTLFCGWLMGPCLHLFLDQWVCCFHWNAVKMIKADGGKKGTMHLEWSLFITLMLHSPVAIVKCWNFTFLPVTDKINKHVYYVKFQQQYISKGCILIECCPVGWLSSSGGTRANDREARQLQSIKDSSIDQVIFILWSQKPAPSFCVKILSFSSGSTGFFLSELDQTLTTRHKVSEK